MISARTLNTIEDYMIESLEYRQIERVFEDNGIRRPFWMPVKNKLQLLQAYRDTVNVHLSEETKLLFVAEAIEKIYRANDIIAYPEGHQGAFKKKVLLDLVKTDGYELVDGKLISIHTPMETIAVEDPKTTLLKRYNELKSHKKTDPAYLIGTSKDLLESLFKTMCDRQNIPYAKDGAFDALRKNALENLELIPVECTGKAVTNEYIKHMITIVSLKINEIRNIHGTGHGKSDHYQPIDLESAILVANLAISIATYFIPKISELKPV